MDLNVNDPHTHGPTSPYYKHGTIWDTSFWMDKRDGIWSEILGLLHLASKKLFHPGIFEKNIFDKKKCLKNRICF